MTMSTKLSSRQHKVLKACQNGWYMGGRYQASIDGHERVFAADSVSWLADEVDAWLASHEEHHANDHLLVRCVEAC
jgi:hypothetical protein